MIDRLYRLKGRAADVPAAVMFFDLELALAALPELGVRTREAVERLLPAHSLLLATRRGATRLRADLSRSDSACAFRCWRARSPHSPR